MGEKTAKHKKQSVRTRGFIISSSVHLDMDTQNVYKAMAHENLYF